MPSEIESALARYDRMGLLQMLLADRTTKRNILWATDAYHASGDAYAREREITRELITGRNAGLIRTRAEKAAEVQAERTRQHAEVFTPVRICRMMNDWLDEQWFGRKDAFQGEKVALGKKKWTRYVDSRRLEITCGEAPYLVSRYDAATGKAIPLPERTGLLDRKLRIVNENTETYEEWLFWTERAYQSVYGYEFQGDNLLIARVNLLLTLEEYMREKWQREPDAKTYKSIVRVIAYNLWQMDGLKGTVPYSKEEKAKEPSLLDYLKEQPVEMAEEAPPENRMCMIFDWRGKNRIQYTKAKEGRRRMKFDFIIGNPPYQDTSIGDNKTFAPPIYHMFLEEAYKVSDRVEMIHPARFLFNAGSTPKAWNAKMLNNNHFRILAYYQNSSDVFCNTDIKGGWRYHTTVKQKSIHQFRYLQHTII